MSDKRQLQQVNSAWMSKQHANLFIFSSALYSQDGFLPKNELHLLWW